MRSRSSRWVAAVVFGGLALVLGGCGGLSGALQDRSSLAGTPGPGGEPGPAPPAEGRARPAPGLAAAAFDLLDTQLVVPAAWTDLDVHWPAEEEAGEPLPARAASSAPLWLAQGSAGARPNSLIEEYDPWEPFNEKMFAFNRELDRLLIKPVARAYDVVVPDRLQQMIASGFDNIRVVPRVVNSLLQGKWAGAGREVARFLINSVVGIGGLFDMAKQEWGIEKSEEDFGQTLGVWGSGPGPYLVLPLLPPLTVRDGVGFVVDSFLDPLTYVLSFVPTRLGMRTGEMVNERALNLELFQGFEETTLDLYSAVRNGYLQRRHKLISE